MPARIGMQMYTPAYRQQIQQQRYPNYYQPQPQPQPQPQMPSGFVGMGGGMIGRIRNATSGCSSCGK